MCVWSATYFSHTEEIRSANADGKYVISIYCSISPIENESQTQFRCSFYCFQFPQLLSHCYTCKSKTLTGTLHIFVEMSVIFYLMAQGIVSGYLGRVYLGWSLILHSSGIHPMKQFAHNLFLPCCHCTEASSRVSSYKNAKYLHIIHMKYIWGVVYNARIGACLSVK